MGTFKYPSGKNHERECRASVKTPLIRSTTSRTLIAQIWKNFQVGKNQVAQKDGCKSASKQRKLSNKIGYTLLKHPVIMLTQ